MINLLLVDPQPIVRCVFKNFLADYDFLDVVFTTGKVSEAITHIESNPIDIMISEMCFENTIPIDLIDKVKK